jgi:hypothetical protein
MLDEEELVFVLRLLAETSLHRNTKYPFPLKSLSLQLYLFLQDYACPCLITPDTRKEFYQYSTDSLTSLKNEKRAYLAWD